MIKSKKVISIYEPNDIYKVIEELNKGARELGKLTLEEQTKRAERLIAGWRNRQTHSVVGGHNLKVRFLPLQPTFLLRNNYLLYSGLVGSSTQCLGI